MYATAVCLFPSFNSEIKSVRLSSYSRHHVHVVTLELFFTPKNTPPKPKNSKLDESPIFFWTPCRYMQPRLHNITFFF